MKLEEAIKTALEYEVRIRDLYRDYAEQLADEKGKKVFGYLAKDEQRHVDYLEFKLKEWQESGKVTVEDLETIIPPKEKIAHAMKGLSERMGRDDRGVEQQMLSKALKVEMETSAMYEKLVAEMEGDVRKMFARFLEIEEGHVAAVQYELDYVANTGYWCDFLESEWESY